MKSEIFLINQDKRLEASTLETFLREVQNRKSYYWINVWDAEMEGLIDLLSPLELHPLIMESCLNPEALGRVSLYGQTIFIQMPVQSTWDKPGRSFLYIICIPQAIITIQAQPLIFLESFLKDFTTVIGHHEVSNSGILYFILDRLIDETMVLALQARRAVDTFEEKMTDDVATDQIGGRILDLKRIVTQFEITLEEQHHCLTALLSLETESFSIKGFHEYFHDAVSNLKQSMHYVERMETRLSELHKHSLLILQDKTNNRLKILTILSAVFMPLTLISGIYGMNFHFMPELRWHYGYPLILLSMVALATGLLLFFYRRNWFK